MLIRSAVTAQQASLTHRHSVIPVSTFFPSFHPSIGVLQCTMVGVSGRLLEPISYLAAVVIVVVCEAHTFIKTHWNHGSVRFCTSSIIQMNSFMIGVSDIRSDLPPRLFSRIPRAWLSSFVSFRHEIPLAGWMHSLYQIHSRQQQHVSHSPLV